MTDSNKDTVSIQEVILFKASSYDNQNSWICTVETLQLLKYHVFEFYLNLGLFQDIEVPNCDLSEGLSGGRRREHIKDLNISHQTRFKYFSPNNHQEFCN